MRIRGLTTPVIGSSLRSCSVYASIDRRNARTTVGSKSDPAPRSISATAASTVQDSLYGTLVDEDVEDVGEVHEPGRQRDRIARQAAWIAAAVPALVVVAGDRLGRLDDVGIAALQHPRAEHGVRFDDLEFLLGQTSRLEQDRVRDRDLADVVQRRRAMDERDLPVRQRRARARAAPRGRPRAGCARACCRRGNRPRATAVAGAPPGRRPRRAGASAPGRRARPRARPGGRAGRAGRSPPAAVPPPPRRARRRRR